MRNKNTENETVIALKDRIAELEQQLVEVANNSGACIVKQLPDGTMELNGVAFDNTSKVDYYNSSKATYGELTMYRVGVEAEKRNSDKMIKAHMEVVDDLNKQIDSLSNQISKLQNENYTLEGQIVTLNNTISNRDSQISDLKQLAETLDENHKLEIENIKQQYQTVIDTLRSQNEQWMNRCLQLNNVQADGTIITKYGEVKNSPKDVIKNLSEDNQ